MSNTTTVKTVLEFSVMPIQRYEFYCTGCFTVKTVNDHGTHGVTLCTDCN